MTDIELEAEKLAQAFIKINRGYDYKKITLKTLKKPKWWGHFLKAAQYYKNKPEWDPYLFVKCLFTKHGKIYPHILSWKTSWDIYLDYKEVVKEKEIDYKEIANQLLQDYKKIKKWMEENNKSFKSFFENKVNLMKIKRGLLSNWFLSLITYTYQIHNFLDIDENLLLAKRAIILKNKKIANKMKEVLGKYFYNSEDIFEKIIHNEIKNIKKTI